MLGPQQRHPKSAAKTERHPGNAARTERHPGNRVAIIRDPWSFPTGFTLLELITVIAVLGILLTIALPTYQNYVLRTHRTEAVGALLEIAGCQENVFAMTGRFDTTRCIPENLEHYLIRMEPEGDSEALVYTAWAEPVGAQSRDACGSLGLDQTGFRQVTGETVEVSRCWRAR